ncbi:MAG: hypothetical protein ACI959_000488 [Limisphaerales bacterium]|jgi:hypothetical protein
MKQIVLSIFVLLALGVAAWLLVFDKDLGSIPIKEKAFAIEDTLQIQKIFLADLGDREIILERKGTTWIVNGKYPARIDAIHTLMKTLTEITVKYPVPKSKFDNVVRDISGKHVKVEIYDVDDNKLKSYYVGNPTPNDRGNFMMLEDSKSPYVVVIPGWDGFLQTRYLLNEEDWKDRTIFRNPVASIDELKIEYPTNTDSSFTISRADEGFEVIPNSFNTNGRLVNQRATYLYLDQLKYKGAEYFSEDPQRDSIITSAPICRISLTDDQGFQQVLNVFYRPLNKRSKQQFDIFGKELEFSRDKYYASYNNDRDFAVIQDFVFGNMFIGPSYFFQPEPDRQQ